MSSQPFDNRATIQPVTLDPRTKVLVLAVREALLAIVVALEVWAGIARSVPPNRERRTMAHQQQREMQDAT